MWVLSFIAMQKDTINKHTPPNAHPKFSLAHLTDRSKKWQDSLTSYSRIHKGNVLVYQIKKTSPLGRKRLIFKDKVYSICHSTVLYSHCQFPIQTQKQTEIYEKLKESNVFKQEKNLLGLSSSSKAFTEWKNALVKVGSCPPNPPSLEDCFQQESMP